MLDMAGSLRVLEVAHSRPEQSPHESERELQFRFGLAVRVKTSCANYLPLAS